MKSTPYARVLVGLLAIIGLLATACGNDDDSASYPPTTERTVDHSEDTAMEGADDGHDHAHEHDHEHDHATLAVNGVKLDATAVVTIPGGSDDGEPMDTGDDAGTTIELEVAGGKPVDGVQRHRIDAGDDVTIIVTGDTADELHIHGYDLVVPFAPGQPGSITFEANIPGIFEVETHHRGDLVMELQVG